MKVRAVSVFACSVRRALPHTATANILSFLEHGRYAVVCRGARREVEGRESFYLCFLLSGENK
jgi:hypothetical protein